MGEVIQVPEWVSDPSKLKDMVLEWVVEWLVSGLWEGVLALVGWIQSLFESALIRPAQSAGSGVMDAFAPVGDALIDLAWGLSAPLRQAATAGPFAPLVVAFLAGVVLVAFAYLLRAAWEAVKGAKWVSPW